MQFGAIGKLGFQNDEINGHVGNGNEYVIDVALVGFHHAGVGAPPSKVLS